VTLLQHFRDYLEQQQKEKAEREATLAAGSSSSSSAHPGEWSAGFPPKAPRAAWTELAAPRSLVFVKKWVRTRHAILFRLSNGTVQVMFLDNTEVLLGGDSSSGGSGGGSGGGSVTFADKQGVRRTVSLAEVVTSPRSDVTKRLKYTKDILRQLISSGKR
jgi:polo-like kinase 1